MSHFTFTKHLIVFSLLVTKLAFAQTPATTPAAAIAPSPSPSPASQSETIYKKPLWFDVVNNGVKVSGPSIVYDLQSSYGKSLQWGPLLLKEDFFSINLTSRQKLDAEGSKMAFYNQEDMVLFFDWPREIIPFGLLEVTDSKGNTIWSKNLQQAELDGWHEKILQVKDQLRKQGKKEEDIENNSLLKKTYAFFRSKSEPGPDLKIDENYKFCLKNTEGESTARICTPFYAMKTVGTQIEMQIQQVADNEEPTQGKKKSKKKKINEKDPGIAQVKFQDATQPLAGKITADNEKPNKFFAQLKSGASIEFTTVAPVLKIYDMALTDDKNPDLSQLVAENPAPVFLKSEVLSNKDPLDPTNKLWKAEYKVSQNKVFLPGKAGAFFQYDIAVEYLPQNKLRPYVSEKNLSATYSQNDSLKYLQDGKTEPEKWETVNPEKAKWNRSYLMVKDDKREHKAYLDIYRGYAGEASLRLTGLTSGSSTAVMTEFHVGYWFNSIAGWDQYYLSRQRWGVSAKYMNLLSDIEADKEDGTSQKVKINSTIVDLKYRFSPGLWERDESWGAVLSYENLNYSDYKVPKLGYGIFWARSMPKFFDDIFNLVPIFRYPKWVDLDIVKYSTAMDSKYTLGDDYSINFHGKILWTPRFYGEAGFGAKKYYFLQKETEQGATLNTFYGTLGLGINF
ncbi:hypothetical protein [Bdellovibrio sp. HCB337]|uniref:hypothetical protein n=1 Tax=Bdellovibrio sp. HCB337 TaxID=3394358 RepID=UPI0039A5DF80